MESLAPSRPAERGEDLDLPVDLRVADLAGATAKWDQPRFAEHFSGGALVFRATDSVALPQDLDLVEIVALTSEVPLRENDDSTHTSVTRRPTPSSAPRFQLSGESAVALLGPRGAGGREFVARVGRDPESDVRLTPTSVSSSHAVIWRSRDGWTLVDDSSTNGTFVEMRQLTSGSKAILRNGAALSFGPEVHARFFTPEGLYAFVVEHRGRPAAGSPAPPGS